MNRMLPPHVLPWYINEEYTCANWTFDQHPVWNVRRCCCCLPSLMTENLSFRLCHWRCLYLFVVNVFAHLTCFHWNHLECFIKSKSFFIRAALSLSKWQFRWCARHFSKTIYNEFSLPSINQHKCTKLCTNKMIGLKLLNIGNISSKLVLAINPDTSA